MSHGNNRYRVRVRGAVQGVGFRPFVFRKASELGLSGWVKNDGEGVVLEVEAENLDGFIDELTRRIRTEAPPLSRIDSIEQERIPASGGIGFSIIQSARDSRKGISTEVLPDAVICKDCLQELFSPADRHYLYPFLNCTHCGPRYTIIRELPYDRSRTSMAAFRMCKDCEAEYTNPMDRRFHAEPTACPACGPRLSMPLQEIVRHLTSGDIVAIKGLGGFHLACDAKNEKAVSRLRELKDREAKPLAVMVLNPASAERLGLVSDTARSLLTSRASPIVLLDKKEPSLLARSIAPGLASVGVMLPYTPLQYLLFFEAAGRPEGTAWLEEPLDTVFVMTSANPRSEPLVIGNDEARERLGAIADVIVTHDRDIVIRADDSVMGVTDGKPCFVRRARGFVPEPIKLGTSGPSILALGSDLKNTICVTRRDEAFVSQHVGDLENAATLGFLEETIDHLLDILDVEPQMVAHDLHPDFFSTQAAGRFSLPKVPCQHHHSHLASVMAEHRLHGPALGLALDGFGLGERNEAWGGELMLLDRGQCTRLGHLAPLRQPGGNDMASREPWRMAASVLFELGLADEITARFKSEKAASQLTDLLQRDLNCPPTTSCGRLFDAAAALLGAATRSRYEGEAPMRLESLVEEPESMNEGWMIHEDNSIGFMPLFRRLLVCAPVHGAGLFHGTLAAGLSDWIEKASKKTGIRTVVLGGGCICNRVLTEALIKSLSASGLDVRIPCLLPPNDGGISLGQAWIALQGAASDGRRP